MVRLHLDTGLDRCQDGPSKTPAGDQYGPDCYLDQQTVWSPMTTSRSMMRRVAEMVRLHLDPGLNRCQDGPSKTPAGDQYGSDCYLDQQTVWSRPILPYPWSTQHAPCGLDVNKDSIFQILQQINATLSRLIVTIEKKTKKQPPPPQKKKKKKPNKKTKKQKQTHQSKLKVEQKTKKSRRCLCTVVRF